MSTTSLNAADRIVLVAIGCDRTPLAARGRMDRSGAGDEARTNGPADTPSSACDWVIVSVSIRLGVGVRRRLSAAHHRRFTRSGPLAQGTVYLLLPRHVADRLVVALVTYVAIASALAVATPLLYELAEPNRLSGEVMAGKG